MSKRRSKQSSPESAAPADENVSAATTEAASDSRDVAVEELDEALDALPGGGGEAGAGEEHGNPLARIDVSGETSFDSAEFEEEDEEDEGDAADDDEDGDLTDDEASDDAKAEFVIHDADAEDLAEAYERMRAESTASARRESAEDEVAPGGQPRELAELVAISEALIFVSEEPLSV